MSRKIFPCIGVSLIVAFCISPAMAGVAENSTAADNSSLVVDSRQMLHTFVEIKAYGDAAAGAVQDAFSEMERVNGLLNNYAPESDISRINASAGGPSVPVAPETAEALKIALRYGRLSGGALDITVGPLLALWGFAQETPGLQGTEPSPRDIQKARALVDYRLLFLTASTGPGSPSGSARLQKRGMWIDVGSFSKGYCADRAMAVLKRKKVKGALVTAGGTICAYGLKPDGSLWKIAVRHPRKEDDFMTFVELAGTTISTSGDYERFYTKNGKRRGHIIDPRTGMPVERMQSVSVIAPTGAESDALSTAVFVLGPEKGAALIERIPDASGLLVTSDGKVVQSNRWPQKIVLY